MDEEKHLDRVQDPMASVLIGHASTQVQVTETHTSVCDINGHTNS